MARLRYDTILAADVGTDVNVEESIGSLTTNPEATDLVGLIVNKANSTGIVAGEGVIGKYIWKLGSLAFDNLEFQDGEVASGAPATNAQTHVANPKFVPFASVNPNVGNKKINVSYEQLAAATADVSCLASIAYAEGSVPADVLGNLYRLQTRVRWNGSDTESIDNTPTQQFSNSLNIPNWVNEIVAIGITIGADDTLDADKHFVGYLDFSSGGSLPNMTPTRIPLPTIGNQLGTPVGAGLVSKEVIMPLYIKLPNADVTVKPSIVVQEAYDCPVFVTYTLYGR